MRWVLSDRATKWLVMICAIAFVSVLVVLDPNSTYWFVKCPFKAVFGLQCPGCGSQRAVFALLHGNWKAAFALNPIFVLAIPYIGLGFLSDLTKENTFGIWIRKHLFGAIALRICMVVVLVFTVLRNV
jgi:hypothetical protein